MCHGPPIIIVKISGRTILVLAITTCLWYLSKHQVLLTFYGWKSNFELTILKLTIRPDFYQDMWLIKSCGLRPQVNTAASGREYGFLWLQRCCCLRQQPTVAASGRKRRRSSKWATQKMVSLHLEPLDCAWWCNEHLKGLPALWLSTGIMRNKDKTMWHILVH